MKKPKIADYIKDDCIGCTSSEGALDVISYYKDLAEYWESIARSACHDTWAAQGRYLSAYDSLSIKELLKSYEEKEGTPGKSWDFATNPIQMTKKED
jgi:hypothetical protein